MPGFIKYVAVYRYIQEMLYVEALCMYIMQNAAVSNQQTLPPTLIEDGSNLLLLHLQQFRSVPILYSVHSQQFSMV